MLSIKSSISFSSELPLVAWPKAFHVLISVAAWWLGAGMASKITFISHPLQCKIVYSAGLVLSLVSNILVCASLEAGLPHKRMPPLSRWMQTPACEKQCPGSLHCQAPLKKVGDRENHCHLLCGRGCSWLHGTPRFCCCQREPEYGMGCHHHSWGTHYTSVSP